MAPVLARVGLMAGRRGASKSFMSSGKKSFSFWGKKKTPAPAKKSGSFSFWGKKKTPVEKPRRQSSSFWGKQDKTQQQDQQQDQPQRSWSFWKSNEKSQRRQPQGQSTWQRQQRQQPQNEPYDHPYNTRSKTNAANNMNIMHQSINQSEIVSRASLQNNRQYNKHTNNRQHNRTTTDIQTNSVQNNKTNNRTNSSTKEYNSKQTISNIDTAMKQLTSRQHNPNNDYKAFMVPSFHTYDAAQSSVTRWHGDALKVLEQYGPLEKPLSFQSRLDKGEALAKTMKNLMEKRLSSSYSHKVRSGLKVPLSMF